MSASQVEMLHWRVARVMEGNSSNSRLLCHADPAASLAFYRPVSGKVARGNHRSRHPYFQHPSADSQLH